MRSAIVTPSTRRFITGFVALGAIFLMVSGVWAAGGNLLWKKQFDLAGGQDRGFRLAVDGGRVFAAGEGMNAGGNMDAVIRAYNAKTGGFLWMNQFDLAGSWDTVMGVSAEGGRVFAGLQSVNAVGNWDFVVRAHDAATGALLWVNQFDLAAGDDYLVSLAVRGGRVYAAGGARNAVGNQDFIVRAYDAEDGALLWMNQFDLAGRDDSATFALAVRGGRVYAGGFGTNAAGNRDFVVRAYRANDGMVLWMDQFDLAGDNDTVSDGGGSALALRGGKVFAGGYGTNAAGNRDLLVRAYDAPTGALLWMNQFDLAGDWDEAFALTVRGGRVYAGGFGTNASGNFDFLVRAHEAATGNLVWADQFDAGDNDSVFSLDVRGGRVFAAGVAANSGGHCYEGWLSETGNCDFVVRAYEAPTGSPLWMKQFDLAGGLDFAGAVAVRGGKVFVVGTGTNAGGNGDFLVRAYDAK